MSDKPDLVRKGVYDHLKYIEEMLGKLAGQTMTYGLSTIVGRFLNYMLVPYYTRIMTDAQYGVVTDMYAFIPFALIVLTMGMESGYFRFAAKAQDEGEKRRVFATAWGAVSVVSVLFMAVVLLFLPQVAGAMRYSDHPSFVWMVAAIVAVDAISAVPFARLREQGRALRYSILKLVCVLVNLALSLFFYLWLPGLAERGVLTALWSPEFGPGYVFVANLIASGVTFFLLLPSCDGVAPRISRRLFKKIFLYSMPLLISGIAGTANEFIDRQMIKFLMPAEQAMSALGIYGAIVKIGVVMLIFTQMYRLAAEPFFLAEFRGDDFRRANAEAMKYYVIVSVFIFLVIALFADVFVLIVGPGFREGAYILPVVLVANMLSGVVLNLSFWYKQTGQTRFAIYVTGTGLVFTVVFNVLLIPRLGYFGAAIARLICEVVMVAVSYFLNRKYYPTPYDLRRIGEYVLLGGALYGAGVLAEGLPGAVRYFLYSTFVVIFVCYVVWREKINVRGLLKAITKRR